MRGLLPACLLAAVAIAAMPMLVQNQRLVEPELASPAAEPYPWIGLEDALDDVGYHRADAPASEEGQDALDIRVDAWARAVESMEFCAEMGLPITEEAFLDVVDMWLWDTKDADLAYLFEENRAALLAFMEMQRANAELRIATGDPDELVEFHEWPAWHGIACYDCDTHLRPITETDLMPHVEAWQRAADILGAIITAEIATLEAAR